MPQKSTSELLMLLLRCAVFLDDLPQSFALSEDEAKAVRQLANKHDVLHLVEYAVKTQVKNPDFGSDTISKAVYRCTQQDAATAQIRSIFEEKKIPFILLKGAVIRPLYPEAWMRTSADIDVLVREENSRTAASELVKNAGYSITEEYPHEIHIMTPSGVCVELHHTLLLPDESPKAAHELSNVWEDSEAIPDSYERRMSDSHFILYFVAHMAKHMRNGGCGIRSVMDVYLLTHSDRFDTASCDSILEECGLLRFAQKIGQLGEAWFGGKELKGLDSLAEYIISGGTFGSADNSAAYWQQQRGSKSKYLLSRIFPPSLKEHPSVKKNRLMLPVLWVKRWFKIFGRKDRNRAANELRAVRGIDRDRVKAVNSLMEELGLASSASDTEE